MASSPAQAERLVQRDKAGDVRVLRIQFIDDHLRFVRASHRKQRDDDKVKLWHQVKSVRAVGRFRQPDRKGLGLSQMVAIRTPGDLKLFQVDAGRRYWKGIEIGFDDLDSACMRHKVNYARDRFAMRTSRACLGRPAWVRVGVAFVSMDRRSVGIDGPLGTRRPPGLPVLAAPRARRPPLTVAGRLWKARPTRLGSGAHSGRVRADHDES